MNIDELNKAAERLEEKHIIESAKGSEESKDILAMVQYFRIVTGKQ